MADGIRLKFPLAYLDEDGAAMLVIGDKKCVLFFNDTAIAEAARRDLRSRNQRLEFAAMQVIDREAFKKMLIHSEEQGAEYVAFDYEPGSETIEHTVAIRDVIAAL